MGDHKQDSPAVRDRKAEDLEGERAVRAEDLARELRTFRWEVRVLYAVVLVVSIVGAFGD